MVGPRGELRIVRVDERNWPLYRAVRLEMLLESPRAFGATYADALARSDQDWLDRVSSGPSWLAFAADGVTEALSEELSERVLGSVGTFRFEEQAADETALVAMWVRPSARGTGVGEALVRTVLQDAAGQGRRRVTLDVATENQPARALYERLGFLPTGRTGTLPGDPTISELEMAVDLRRP